MDTGSQPQRASIKRKSFRRADTMILPKGLDLSKPIEKQKYSLENSTLNQYGYFDSNIKKIRGSRLQQYDNQRAQISLSSAKLLKIDQKYGGKPKQGQQVREGHYPKISELIDQIEKIALDFVGFEKFAHSIKS